MKAVSDTSSIDIDAPAERAFAHVSYPRYLDRWSFGTWETTIADDGLVEGRTQILDPSRSRPHGEPEAGEGHFQVAPRRRGPGKDHRLAADIKRGAESIRSGCDFSQEHVIGS